VTHETVRAEDFNGTHPVVRNVLAAFDADATRRWFASMGVTLKREETGKLFPTTDRAQTVLDALLRRCDVLGVRVLTSHRVHDVTPVEHRVCDERVSRAGSPPGARSDVGAPRWRIRHAHGTLVARAVVLATGGRSLPRTGSDGAGFAIAERLGHRVTATVPALVPFVLESAFHRELSGVSHPVELETFVDGRLADRRTGSLLWTHFGVSGPVVLDASRHWTMARHAGRAAEVHCSVFPGERLDAIERRLLAASGARPRASLARVLAETLPERVAAALARAAGVDPTTRLAELSRPARRTLARHLGGLVLPVARDRGWNHAEVTAGGVPLDEIDYRTMASRKQAGLYLVGEMLDCDGRIGGFNFQWAWATGFLAGRAAVDLCSLRS
jgi:predicted flavoprotein YhiN